MSVAQITIKYARSKHFTWELKVRCYERCANNARGNLGKQFTKHLEQADATECIHFCRDLQHNFMHEALARQSKFALF